MGTPALWIAFNLFVLLMLGLDLGVFHRRAHALGLREATAWSVAWVLISLGCNAWLLVSFGQARALQFLTGYVIEKSLSMDNIFVFALLFRYFAVEARYQHRVLFWGILGALVMRGAMIAAGVALIRHFEWVLYLFGAFLVYAGAKMMVEKTEEIHPERNPVFRWARKFLPMTKAYEGERFFVRGQGVWKATPLLLVLLVVETTDAAFASDSIPAVFAVTRDPFIVYTSNVFAVLGLRAFYFLLAGALPYCRYLSTGLSVVLIFIGAKMLGEKWVPISTGVSLSVVGAVLAIAIVSSVVAARLARASDAGETLLAPLIGRLADHAAAARQAAARELYRRGSELARPAFRRWTSDPQLAALLGGSFSSPDQLPGAADVTVGLAVQPEMFERIRAAAGSPPLADVPPNQDAREFKLHFGPEVGLDVLTTKEPGGNGAIARFLEKFGEGIQQVECRTVDVDRATQLLRARFHQEPVYPETRPGADGTRVNFFLARTPQGKKVLIELVEAPRKRSE
jgi:tellurite resistance protein TerC